MQSIQQVRIYLLHVSARADHPQVRTIKTQRLMYKNYYCTKGKVRPGTGHEGSEGEQRYSSPLSLTSALDGGGWLTPLPGRFTPGKEIRYPFYRRLGWPQGLSGPVRKISPAPGFDLLTIQLISSRYTDWAIAAYTLLVYQSQLQSISVTVLLRRPLKAREKRFSRNTFQQNRMFIINIFSLIDCLLFCNCLSRWY